MKKTNKRLPRPRLTRLKDRRQAAEDRVKDAFADVPRITNETVAEHREDVLRGARKYIYPLKHSRRRVVTISITLFVAALVIFFTYTTVALYKLQSTSGFLYEVTKVVPYPVAKAGGSWVSYNSYLFELRHYMHYYTTQQGVDFKSDSGKAQLARYKGQALNQVISDAYVKQLAKKNRVTVSDRQVNDQVTLVRSQNRLGSSQRQFEEVLNEFWGWDQNDFKHELKQELLAQAVVSKLDTNTHTRADAALQQLKGGADFAAVAAQVSDDQATKANGGQYTSVIDNTDASIPPAVTVQLFKLSPGQYSDIINTGYTLEIVKVNNVQDGKIQASHMEFDFKPVSDYTAPLQKSHPAKRYIKV